MDLRAHLGPPVHPHVVNMHRAMLHLLHLLQLRLDVEVEELLCGDIGWTALLHEQSQRVVFEVL